MSKPKKIESTPKECELLIRVRAEIRGLISDYLAFDGIETDYPSANKVAIQLENIIKFINRIDDLGDDPAIAPPVHYN